ncbi:hypothetical protein [Microbispora sp. CA-102843]|uniref:hypothetical protein n=1 Tax=Microbispora sp. CA-102843 TaxID=3239952 RepID=UPI003D90D60E
MTREQLTAQIVNAIDNPARAYDLIEHLWEMARQDGMNDLVIDLWDAKELTTDAVEFAIENNGVTDPRR